MCVYCMTGDQFFQSPRPPWIPSPWPQIIPSPPVIVEPYRPWSLDEIKEFQDLLRRVKDLEEKVIPCPCEPNKADYLTMCAERIAQLEKEAESP